MGFADHLLLAVALSEMPTSDMALQRCNRDGGALIRVAVPLPSLPALELLEELAEGGPGRPAAR